MTSTRQRLQTTILLLVASLGLAVAVGSFGPDGGVLDQLATALLALGWFVAAPLYFLWWSRRSTDATGSAATRDPVTTVNRTRSGRPAKPDPLTILERRYAAGEIDETEFERRLERLLVTNDLDVDRDALVAPSADPSGSAADRPRGARERPDAPDERRRSGGLERDGDDHAREYER